MQEWPGSLLGASGAGKSTTLNILGAMENNDKVALAVAFSTTLGGIMAIVKLAMGLWTMSVLFIVSAVYYAMLCDAAAAALDGAGVGRRFPGRCRSCSRDHG